MLGKFNRAFPVGRCFELQHDTTISGSADYGWRFLAYNLD